MPPHDPIEVTLDTIQQVMNRYLKPALLDYIDRAIARELGQVARSRTAVVLPNGSIAIFPWDMPGGSYVT